MKLEKYINMVVESSDNQIDEAVSGKYYDWNKDFIFTKEVIQDLRKRDLLGVKDGGGIYVMVPVNRDNPPNRYSPDTFDYLKDKNGNWKDGKEPDFKPYNILHIKVIVDAKDKKVEISRFFGHRLDWVGEEFTNEERDWTTIPVLTRKTVESLFNVYNDYDIFDKLLDNIIVNTAKHEEYLDRNKITDEYLQRRAKSEEDYLRYVARADAKTIQDKLEQLAKRRKDYRTYYKIYADNCEAIVDGHYKNFEWEFDYPEIPSKEEIEKVYNRHKKYADSINKGLSDYYSKREFTGD